MNPQEEVLWIIKDFENLFRLSQRVYLTSVVVSVLTIIVAIICLIYLAVIAIWDSVDERYMKQFSMVLVFLGFLSIFSKLILWTISNRLRSHEEAIIAKRNQCWESIFSAN